MKECVPASCAEYGVLAVREGTKVDAEGCTLQENVESGICARNKAVVDVRDCRSSRHTHAGYLSDTRAVMTASSSCIQGDNEGCVVNRGGELTMDQVSVDGTLQSGKLATP